MRLLALMVTLVIILTACSSDDDAPTPDDPAASPTTFVETPATDDSDPNPTPADDPTGTDDVVPSPTDEPEPTGAADPSPTSEVTAETSTLDEDIARIAEETAAVRGLELLDDINSQIINREQLGANMVESIERDYGQEQANLDRDLLWMLRLIPDRGLDYYQLQVDLLTEQVAGYYDPETGELFVISDASELTTDQRVTMSHEITHAIQDQHFGLDRFEDDEIDFDRITAFQSVVEGDATWTMVQWAVEYLSLEELGEFLTESATQGTTDIFDNAPRYVRDSLMFAYNAGFMFIEQLIQAGGPGAVDAALSDPPVSTEQILHPEKYLNEPRDIPLSVDIPDLTGALGKGWQETYQGTLGEFDLGILLEENGLGQAGSAVQGWGGTRFVMYQSGDDALTVLSTRWDTEADAAEFDEALRQTMDSYTREGDTWTDGTRHHAIISEGDRVILTTSTNPDALQSALNGQQVMSP